MLPRGASSKGIVPFIRKQYNQEEATSIAFWIEEVNDEDLEFPEDIQASLRSGVDLCRLINVIQPGTIGINTNPDPPAYDDNITAYLDTCYNFGLSTYDLFEPQDLTKNGDVQRVLRNIVALARLCVSNNINVPKLEIDDRCEREDCSNKLESLLGEIGSLKRNIKAKEEHNRELFQENEDIQDKLARQAEQISILRATIQTLESTNSDLNDKYQHANIEIHKLQQQLEQQQQQKLEQTQQETQSPRHIPERAVTLANLHHETQQHADVSTNGEVRKTHTNSGDFSTKKAKKKLDRANSFDEKSADAKKIEEMRKFINKEKKEILKQEKARRKQEEKQTEDGQVDSPSLAKLSKGLRSLTLSKLKKPKDKDKHKQQDDKLVKSDGAIGMGPITLGLQREGSWQNLMSLPHPKVAAKVSPLVRTRSYTAAAKLVSKPTNDTTHDGHKVSVLAEYNITPRGPAVS